MQERPHVKYLIRFALFFAFLLFVDGASKAALNQLTRLMAVELGKHGIRYGSCMLLAVHNVGFLQAVLNFASHIF
eukprot:SAG31_NODE_41884_length_274_cov_0.588571_1_plen_74_part_10